MSCTNCFNGCAETISDQCVKYTGIDVPALGISNGDNLLSVENAIINFLVPAINGTGIKPIIDPDIICNIVRSYLPACTTCTGFTLNEVLTAIIKAACDLQTQVTTNTNAIATLNANYTIGCLSGVTASSDTHDIVQAVINNLCNLNSAFSILIADLAANNVTRFNINGYITTYLASQPSTNSANARMVPYCPIAYYGPLSGYPTATDSLSLTGQGIGYWAKVYLCNGATAGVPDLRGRVVVGTTVMGNNAFPPQTDPCGSCTTCANPTYALGTVQGSNCITLTTNELPNHTHLNTAVATTPPHSHFVANIDSLTVASPLSATNYVARQTIYANDDYNLAGTNTVATIGLTSDATQVITVTMTNAATGSGDAHLNIQPVIALHYIMYIP
jgi:microcystin-dependent protein